MAYSLLGAHVNTTVGGLPELIARWKPPLVVLLDHSDAWHRVKAESPDTTFVGRLFLDGEPDFNVPSPGPIKAARDTCARILPWAERMGETYSYWQGVNEPIISSPIAMQRFAAFEAERTRIMAAHGFRVVVGSFSVGNPSLPYWRQFLPALEAARQYHGALALHEYAWPTLDRDAPWYALRHRKVYHGEPDHDWAGFPSHLKSLPLLITECGLDGLLEQGSRPRGWRALHGADPDRYLRQLDWYNTQLLRDPYVIGAAIYCLATPDPQWQSYDVWPNLAGMLAGAAKPLYRLGKKPPEEPVEPFEPPEPRKREESGWRMEVERRPGARIIAGSLPGPGIQVTVADPWGNASTVTSGSKPEYGPGGFEVLAPNPAAYTVAFLDQRFEVQTRDGATIVTFTGAEPPAALAADRPAPPQELPEESSPKQLPVQPPKSTPSNGDEPMDEEARFALALEKLNRIVELLRQRS
jgi:hypothetical protein